LNRRKQRKGGVEDDSGAVSLGKGRERKRGYGRKQGGGNKQRKKKGEMGRP